MNILCLFHVFMYGYGTGTLQEKLGRTHKRDSPMDSFTRTFKVLVWFGLVLWHINLCRLFNAKSIFM